MDKNIYFGKFYSGWGPYLAGINIRDTLLQNIMIMATYCMFYF